MESTKEKRVKRPIRRSIFIVTIIVMVLIVALTLIPSYWLFSSSFYRQYNKELSEVITYVENHTDVDDLKQCVDTKTHSVKYDELQEFLNGMIDDLNLAYLYIVIPTEDIMYNVISATSAAEFEAGEDNMPLLETSDGYSKEQLQEFLSFWDSNDINFFEESSEWGTFYTGCKALKASDGKTVALLCVDLEIKAVKDSIISLVGYIMIILAVSILTFGIVLIIFIHNKISKPILALDRSARTFSAADGISIEYDAPDIHSQNEVQSLGDSIKKMTDDINKFTATNTLLEQKVEDAEKIAKLSNIVSTLMNNMPALTFYKDAETGRYITCNVAFAKYAGKQTVEEVIGNNDYDLFDEETAHHFVTDDHRALESDHPYQFVETVPDAAGNIKKIETVKVKFYDPDGRLCILGIGLDLTEMMMIKEKQEEVQETIKQVENDRLTYSIIARALSLDYSYIFFVDISKNDSFLEYRSDVDSEDLVFERTGSNFFEQSRTDARLLLHPDDQDGFIEAFTKENIISKIESTGSFTFTYRLIISGVPHYMHMKASRLRNEPNSIIFGVSNIDAQMDYQKDIERIQEERITYGRISALSGDYICVYTVDPETEEYIEYNASAEYASLGLAKTGDHFFDKILTDGEKVVYPDDLEKYLQVMKKEYILETVRNSGMFRYDYRLVISDTPVYVALKVAMIKEKNKDYLIVGVINIDDQVRRELEYAHNLSDAKIKADIDALTGVKNKHAYIDLEQSINRLIEEHEAVEFAVVIFDINELKHINDVYGHNAGDEYIRSACKIICDIFKHSPVFRVGGDEFAIIVQGDDYENIDDLMKKIHKINEEHAKTGEICIATGMAIFHNERNVSAVFEKADKKMYKNKTEIKEASEN